MYPHVGVFWVGVIPTPFAHTPARSSREAGVGLGG